MEKFLKIGEQYVQWIALGLGALFLILVGVFYVAKPPVTVSLDKKDYLPGEIDQQIYTRATTLHNDIGDKTVWVKPEAPNPVAELKTEFVDRLPPVLATVPAPREFDPKSGIPDSQPSLTPSVPKAPAAVIAVSTPSIGTSLLGIPAPTHPAANVPAGAPAVAAPAAAVQPVLSREDRDWVTYQWTISAKALDDAFQAAHVPPLPDVYKTALLKVETVREELLLDGKWGPETLVPEIPTVERLPLPAESAPVNPEKSEFRDWAVSKAQSIATPPFFAVMLGTPWYPPGTARPKDVFAPAGAPPPAAPLAGVPNGAPPVGSPHRGPGIMAGPRNPYEIRGAVGPAGPPGVPLSPHGGVIRQYPPPTVAPTAPPGGLGLGMMPVAAGVGGAAGYINPAAPAPDVMVYTHDWTVQPGHTYRYKMRYWISNPLFKVEQENVRKEDRNLLAITSPYSEWTAPIEIPSRYRFWVQNFQKNNTDEVTFDLFTHKPGAPAGLERTTVRVTPGDSIGPSPWLLVDVRQDSSRHNIYYFLVADPAGHIERHDLEKDKQDPDHQDMRDKTGATAAAIGTGG